MGYVQKLSIPFLYRLITKASEEKNEAKEFEMYCAVLPYLEKPKTFNQWRDEAKGKAQEKQRNKVYYDEDMDNLMAELKGGGFNGTI